MLSARKEFSFYLWVMSDIGHCLMENLKWFWVENKECSIDFFLSIGLEWALKLNEKVPSYMKLKRNFERCSREILNWLLNNDRRMLKLNVFVKWFVIYFVQFHYYANVFQFISRTKPSITVAISLFCILNSIQINILI